MTRLTGRAGRARRRAARVGAVVLLATALVACAVVLLTQRSSGGAVAMPQPPGAAATPASSSATPDQTTTQPVDVRDPGRPLRVLFAGDSLTYGSFAATREQTFRALVTKGLREQLEVATDTVGGPGKTSAMVAKTVRPRSYDLVVVETGTNDATKERPELLRKSYANLLSTVRRASPGAGLVCVGSWLGSQSADRVDDVIGSECLAAGGVFVPVADMYLDDAYRGPAGRPSEFGVTDDFHPNDAGHAEIAARILHVVRVDRAG